MVRRQIARARRVTVGLIRPSSRPAYIAAIRSAGRPQKRTAKRASATPATAFVRVPLRDTARVSACRVCGHSPVDLMDLQERQRPERILTVETCPSCGHVANPDNVFDYRRYTSATEMTPGPRIGTEDREGREFHMAKLAVDVLGRSGLEVLVFGAGRSLDNHHIERLDAVASAAISDIMQVRDDAPFIPADAPAPRRFDIVVASEVLEHFPDPKVDLPHLFGFVADDGLLVCSTNIMDGTDLTTIRYPFFRGHVSLYSPMSLGILAKEHGYLVDFRTPLIAMQHANRQKRYVLFTRSPAVMAGVARYFGTHTVAPSDPPTPKPPRP